MFIHFISAYLDTMNLLLNSEFGWAERLAVVIGGSAGVNVGVLWANSG